MIATTRPTQSPADELQRAAELLVKHWTLALPSAAASLFLVVVLFVGILSTIVTVLMGHAAAGHVGTGVGLGTGLLIMLVLLAAGCLGIALAQTMVMAAAPAVYAGGLPDLGAALRRTLHRLPDLVVAAAACCVLAVVPLALCVVLIGIPLLFALGFVLMFVPAAVVIGGESGIEAIRTSFRLTTRHTGESFIAWLGIMAALVAGTIANSIAIHFPIINALAGFVIGGFTSAYAALVTARFYALLRDGAGAWAPPPAPPPPNAQSGGPPSGVPTII